ncbi:MAG: hypothetical protein WCA19_03095 [Candidatus Acidiferrales bacterium]
MKKNIFPDALHFFFNRSAHLSSIGVQFVHDSPQAINQWIP